MKRSKLPTLEIVHETLMHSNDIEAQTFLGKFIELIMSEFDVSLTSAWRIAKQYERIYDVQFIKERASAIVASARHILQQTGRQYSEQDVISLTSYLRYSKNVNIDKWLSSWITRKGYEINVNTDFVTDLDRIV